VSIEDKNSQLMLAKTCKTLYGRYELHYKDETAVVLYNPQSKYDDFCGDINLFQLFNGCLRLKFSSIRDSESSDYPVKILCLNQDSNVPRELDCLSANALIMVPSRSRHITLNASLETFTQLMSLSLSHVIFDDKAFSIVSNFSSIEFIKLKSCKIDNHLFEKCTIPQIKLEYCNFLDMGFIKLPLSLEIFEICSHGSYKVDASDCIKLESL
jgi:hypothetical protein